MLHVCTGYTEVGYSPPYIYYELLVICNILGSQSTFPTLYSPVADPSVLVTSTVKSVDYGLLRTSTGCASPASSSTLYNDWSNITVAATEKFASLVMCSG